MDRGWLNAYVDAARAYPDVSFFGGPITPWFEAEPPAWLSRHLPLLSSCFAVRDGLGELFAPISASYLPFGANMATRRECFEGCSFDVRLGPQGTTEIRGEETALLNIWLDRGLKGIWVKESCVQHFIPKTRLTERYVWNFHCGAGRTQVRSGDFVPTTQIFGVPRWVLRDYLQELAIRIFWSTIKNVRWIKALKRAAVYQGIMTEFRAGATPAEKERGRLFITRTRCLASEFGSRNENRSAAWLNFCSTGLEFETGAGFNIRTNSIEPERAGLFLAHSVPEPSFW